jgi:hypothetical protein
MWPSLSLCEFSVKAVALGADRQIGRYGDGAAGGNL